MPSLRVFGDALRETRAKQKTKSETPLRSMINRGVILLFLFYVLTSSANIGLTASRRSICQRYTASRWKPQRISCRCCCSAMRWYTIRGWLADKTPRHDLVLVISFSIYATLLAIVGTALLPVFLLWAPSYWVASYAASSIRHAT